MKFTNTNPFLKVVILWIKSYYFTLIIILEETTFKKTEIVFAVS